MSVLIFHFQAHFLLAQSSHSPRGPPDRAQANHVESPPAASSVERHRSVDIIDDVINPSKQWEPDQPVTSLVL